MSNKVIFLILAIVLATGVLLPGVFYLGKNSTQNQTSSNKQTAEQIAPTTAPTPDPTANWKTYTDSKYKFSVKYPANLEILISDDYYHYVEFHIKTEGLPKPFPPFYISVIKDDFIAKNPSAYNFMTSDWINDFFDMKVGDSKKDAGVAFKKLANQKVDGEDVSVIGVEATGTSQKRFYIKKNGYLYMIANYEENADYANFISSFKFTQ